MSESLSQSFGKMVTAIEDEIAKLKLIADLRDATHKRCPANVKDSLHELNQKLSTLENQFTMHENFLEKELMSINRLENVVLKDSARQHAHLVEIEKSIPAFLRIGNEDTSDNTIKTRDYLITMEDFDSVPLSTRSRLDLEEVVDMYRLIHTLVTEKEKVWNIYTCIYINGYLYIYIILYM